MKAEIFACFLHGFPVPKMSTALTHRKLQEALSGPPLVLPPSPLPAAESMWPSGYATRSLHPSFQNMYQEPTLWPQAYSQSLHRPLPGVHPPLTLARWVWTELRQADWSIYTVCTGPFLVWDKVSGRWEEGDTGQGLTLSSASCPTKGRGLGVILPWIMLECSRHSVNMNKWINECGSYS